MISIFFGFPIFTTFLQRFLGPPHQKKEKRTKLLFDTKLSSDNKSLSTFFNIVSNSKQHLDLDNFNSSKNYPMFLLVFDIVPIITGCADGVTARASESEIGEVCSNSDRATFSFVQILLEKV